MPGGGGNGGGSIKHWAVRPPQKDVGRRQQRYTLMYTFNNVHIDYTFRHPSSLHVPTAALCLASLLLVVFTDREKIAKKMLHGAQYKWSDGY